jgi:hypothetical protein
MKVCALFCKSSLILRARDNRDMASIEVIDAIPCSRVQSKRHGGRNRTGVPSLQLSDVYQVTGYYLKHSAELAEYFEKRERSENELLAAHRDEWSPRGLRERLLARRKNP